MKLTAHIKNNVVIVICYLYILLFVYTAVSKFLDFENFQVEIAQSPILTAYAGFFARAVIIIELIIALLFTVKRFRIIALYSAYTIMLLFSVYIFIILNFSPYIPCSCGGVLEKMGWTEHLIFNITFCILALIALYLLNSIQKFLPFIKLSILVVLLSITSIIFMITLYISAENSLHHKNNFVRRIPPFIADKAFEFDLKYNSYYFAGADDSNVYLGNISAPSFVTILDSTFTNKIEKQILLNDEIVNITEPIIKVLSPNLFVFDGLSSSVFSGNIKDWKAELKITNIQRFNIAVPIDSSNVIFRSATIKYGNTLGIFDFENPIKVKFNNSILQKQIDGYFDTDGMLLYSRDKEQLIYVYFYRNEFIITDKHLNLIKRSKTIDTISKANIKTKYIESKQKYQLQAPPLIVNKKSAIHKNLLFINSTLISKYEPKSMNSMASIIDVYNINNNSYVMSFYINNIDGKAFDHFIVTENYLYAIFERKVIAYRFNKLLKKEFE